MTKKKLKTEYDCDTKYNQQTNITYRVTLSRRLLHNDMLWPMEG